MYLRAILFSKDAHDYEKMYKIDCKDLAQRFCLYMNLMGVI